MGILYNLSDLYIFVIFHLSETRLRRRRPSMSLWIVGPLVILTVSIVLVYLLNPFGWKFIEIIGGASVKTKDQ